MTDPARIRALAHPVRLDLLSVIDDRGEATATQCAETLGETVANCSFHLRTLATAGFIEPAPARGREKPWRSTSRGRTFEPDLADPSSRLALSEMAGLSMGREVERVRRFLERSGTPPQGWEDTAVVAQSAFYATADELRELTAAVVGLTEKFRDRKQDPSLRPPGARLARLFATVNPDEYPSEEVE